MACGLAWRWRPSIVAFVAAAGSQILLYSAGRAWILGVPASHRPDFEATAHLDQLLVFHLVTLALVGASLAVLANREG